MDKLLPRWAVELGGNPALKADFDQWVSDRCVAYAQSGITAATDMADVKGFRFVIGELEAMRAMVDWTVEEAQRRQHAVSGLVEEKPKRRRRRKSNG